MKFHVINNRATINNNNNNTIITKSTVNSCTPVTTSQELASPSVGSQKAGGIAAKAMMPQGFKSIKYDLYDNADPLADKRKYKLGVATLGPDTKFGVNLNSEFRFFKRGVEDLLDELHYEQIQELYHELNDGTNDVLRLAKGYVNLGQPNKPNMQTVIYQSVILQKKSWGTWFVWHQNGDQLHCCELMTESQIEFTQAQKKTALIATGWLRGDLARPKRYELKDLIKQQSNKLK